MPYFLCRLTPPRVTFAVDMSDDEKALMQTHAAWWLDQIAKGVALLFGPVLDPEGPWGLGIVEVDDESKARALAAGDPVIKAAIGFTYDVLPMQIGAIRGAKT